MRRFLLHVLPSGFHRIRHYGLLANGNRKDGLACVRELLLQPPRQVMQTSASDDAPQSERGRASSAGVAVVR
jgi:hypothetical protein